MIIQDKITKIFCIADCVLRLRAPGRMANLCGVFHVFFVQSKHQQILHFDFESSDKRK